MADDRILLDRITSDGSYLLLVDDGRGHLSVRVNPDAEDGDRDALANLEPEEATEIGLKLLRWVATKLPNGNERALVDLALDRVGRYIGAAL